MNKPMSIARKPFGRVADGLAALSRWLMVASIGVRRFTFWRASFRPRPDDIYIVTYPRSGTTLMQMMLYQLTTAGEMDFEHINTVVPWIEYVAGRDGNRLEDLPSPRVFKTHLRYQQLPRIGRFILVVRNVKDVAVSYYHHLMTGGGIVVSWGRDGYLRRFLRGKVPWGSWYRHLRSWWPHRNDAQVLLLCYEEVVADMEGAVRKVAAFCQLPLTDGKLAQVLERCSFPFMREHNFKFDARWMAMPGPARERFFIRQGASGGWRQDLSAAEAAKLDRATRQLAQRLSIEPESDEYQRLAGGAEPLRKRAQG
jgi:hypothetical protein